MAYNVNVLNLPNVTVADVHDLPPVDVASLPPVGVSSLPDLKISEIGPMGPLTLAGIPDRYTVGISSLPDLNLRIKEIPSIRAHVPANFRLGISLLGVELAGLQLCGEAQIITEPYVPNPCERCGAPRQLPDDTGRDVAAVLRLRDQG
jgi:hypothetical protein